MTKEQLETTTGLSMNKVVDTVDKVLKEAQMAEEEAEHSSKELNIDEYVKSKLSSLDEDEEDVLEIRQITLRMAKMWDSKGHIYEAMDLYKKIIKNYNHSVEAKEAKKVLTNFAKKFESEGRYHLAQSLYDELFL